MNARITERSFNKWQIFPNFANQVFGNISLALPQNLETLKYLKLLKVKDIKIAGNLKYYGKKNNQKEDGKLLKNKFKNHKVWCAASTHNDEEILIGKLHKRLKKKERKLITIIIPRHINRIDKIKSDLNNLNLNYITHSLNQKLRKDTDVYLVDSYGESSKFYNLTNISFVGGSIIKHGGQNPIEASRLGCKILHGPNVSNFKEIYELLKSLMIFGNNPNKSYLADIQSGIFEACKLTGYNLVVQECDYKSPDLNNTILEFVEDLKIDGLILTPPLSDMDDFLKDLEKNQIEHAVIAPSTKKTESLYVSSNDYEAAYKLTSEIIKHGHKDIGFIKGHPPINCSIRASLLKFLYSQVLVLVQSTCPKIPGTWNNKIIKNHPPDIIFIYSKRSAESFIEIVKKKVDKKIIKFDLIFFISSLLMKNFQKF